MQNESLLDKLKLLTRESFLYAIASLATGFLNFILLPVYTRYLTPSDFGIASIMNVFTISLSTVFLLQQTNSVLRLYYDFKEGDPNREIMLSTSYYLVLLCGGGCTAILMVLGPAIFGAVTPEIPYYPYVYYMLPTAFFVNMSYLALVIYRVKRKAASYSVFSFANFAVLTVCVLYFIVLKHEGAAGKIKGSLLGSAIFGGYSIFVTMKYLRPAFSWEIAKKELAFGIPLIPLGLMNWLIVMLNRWFLMKYHSTSVAGLFNVAYTLASVADLLILSIYSAWTPYYYSIAEKESDRSTAIPRLATYFVAGSCACVAMISLFSKEVTLLLTNKSYYEMQTVIPLIAAAFVFRPISFITQSAILQKKKTMYNAYIIIATFIVNIAANMILIPGSPLFGAAWALIISLAFQAAATYFVSQFIFPIRYEYKRTGLLMAATFGIVAASIHLNGMPLSFRLIGIKFGLIAAAILALLILGWFRKEEIDILKKRIPYMKNR